MKNNKNRMTLSENQFKSMVKRMVLESVGKIINEWSFNDWGYMPDIEDWPMVNDESCGRKLYKVGIWCGSGYILDIFRAWANDAESALEYVVAYLDEKGDDSLFVDDAVEKEIEEGRQEGKDDEEIEGEIDAWAIYIDATMFGANCPHWIFSENLTIQEFPKEYLERYGYSIVPQKPTNPYNESLKKTIKEISADLADRAAAKAFRVGREGFGKYGQYNEIPFDSPHGKKYRQGERFLKYRNDKLGINDDIGIFYPNGDDSVMVLKNYNTGEILTKPCCSIKELENEYNKRKAQR